MKMIDLKLRELSWKPKRKGEIYCSPACGRGCTISEFKNAVQEATELCNVLGKHWKPHVWENMGWHWCVQFKSGKLTVWDHGRTYSALLTTGPFTHCGDPEFTDNKGFKDPKEAVRHVIKKAERKIKELESTIKAIELLKNEDLYEGAN